MKPHPFKPNVFFMQARLELGLSQAGLALRLGVSLKQVWRWEKGIAQPHLHYRHLLCALFQKTAEELGFDPGKTAFPQSTFPDASSEAQFRAFLESCQADSVYQHQYQTFVQTSQRLNHQHWCAVSFLDWFLAAHPEKAASLGKQNKKDFNQPASCIRPVRLDFAEAGPDWQVDPFPGSLERDSSLKRWKQATSLHGIIQ